MTRTSFKPFNAFAIGVSAAVLAACGGSEPSPAPADTAEAAEDTVNEAAAAATDAADDAVQTAQATVDEAAEAVEAAAEETVEAAETAAEETEEVVETAQAEVESAAASANDRVSEAVVAEYASLTGDAGNGRRVFTRCMSCHVVQDGVNRVGPSLYGIVGREAGSVEGFRYSPANANSGIVWTEPTLFAYLEDPRGFIPGTIMAFPGLPKAQDRADVIAYLKEESN